MEYDTYPAMASAHAPEDAAHVLDYLSDDHYQPLNLDSQPPFVEGIFRHEDLTSHSLDDIIMETLSGGSEESRNDDDCGRKQQEGDGEDKAGEGYTQEEKRDLGDSTGDTGNPDDTRDEKDTVNDKDDTNGSNNTRDENDTVNDKGDANGPDDNRDENDTAGRKDDTGIHEGNNVEDGAGDTGIREGNNAEDGTGDTDIHEGNNAEDTGIREDNRDENDNKDDKDDTGIREDIGDESIIGRDDTDMEVTEYGEEEADFGRHVHCRAVRVEMLFGDDDVALIDSFVWDRSKRSYRRGGIDRKRRYNLRNHMVKSMGARCHHREFERQCRKVSFTIERDQGEVTLGFDGQRMWRGKIGDIEFQMCFGGVELALRGFRAPVFISRVKV